MKHAKSQQPSLVDRTVMVRLVAVVVAFAAVALGMFSFAGSSSLAESEEVVAEATTEETSEETGEEATVATEETAEVVLGENQVQIGDQIVERAEYTAHVEPFLQFPVLQGGCEVAALSCVLNAMGFDVDEYEISDNWLSYEGNDMIRGYAGDPYLYGSSFPPPMVDAANRFLDAQGSDCEACEITGASFDELLAWVDAGYPVLVWTTMYYQEPQLTGIATGPYEWYDNEHCVALYGFDGTNVFVSDPLEGLIVRDAAHFAHIFEACGNIAFVIS